eukprot:TRINITY_DN3565_c0_g1_i1.p1 TRINITY_DN3565_c0_g1~~TRINITY_DN3565_c0_g1_i1.p1  ORF type:complete len:406 (+),score=145.88 TRINITY_DN3565_c0_g1_i1:277-1494(+)
MEGTFEDVNPGEGSAKLGKLAGMVPRAIQQIFSTLERSGCVYTVKLSIMELYNEELHDMLAPDEEIVVGKDLKVKPKPKLRLFDDNTRKGMGSLTGATMSTVGGVTIAGLEEVPVRKLSEVLDLMRKAMERRQMAETKLNATSSRSHMITTVTLHLKETTDTGEDLWKIGKLNLVDLAGSERQSKTDVTSAVQAAEAEKINMSLLVLGRCLSACSSVGGSKHIPIRESVLTKMLMDIFGGNSRTTMFAAVSPSLFNFSETLSTLQYAHNAKKIKHQAKQNTVAKAAEIKELKEQVKALGRTLIEELEKAGQQKDALAAEVDTVTQERESLANALAETRAENQTLREQLAQLREEVTRLREQGPPPSVGVPTAAGPGPPAGPSAGLFGTVVQPGTLPMATGDGAGS